MNRCKPHLQTTIQKTSSSFKISQTWISLALLRSPRLQIKQRAKAEPEEQYVRLFGTRL